MRNTLLLFFILVIYPYMGQAQPYLQSQTVDVSRDFSDFSNTYFFADSVVSFDSTSASGTLS
ncbi:MAG: hypothetical protein PHS48_02345, partial [Bacteroidales bacterium]|nr:hypothetical protein [Bacteroidales bacterium]